MLHISWSKGGSLWKELLAPLLLFLLFTVFLYAGTNSVSRASSAESTRILEDAVNRSVVQCYASEGTYPPNIEYLEENYGLMVDHKNYIVHYEAFASNIFPNVIIVPLNE